MKKSLIDTKIVTAILLEINSGIHETPRFPPLLCFFARKKLKISPQELNHVPATPRPLGLLLCPAISGGHDILLGDRFRTKLTYTPPHLHTSVELGK